MNLVIENFQFSIFKRYDVSYWIENNNLL